MDELQSPRPCEGRESATYSIQADWRRSMHTAILKNNKPAQRVCKILFLLTRIVESLLVLLFALPAL